MKENNLYLVATPIGNLEDMTFRGVRILKEVDEIYCEDTRVTSVLCNHYGIKKPLHSYHKFNEEKKTEEILDKLHTGQSIALVSDQGMPGISDPGQIVLQRARENGFNPILIPGASSVLMALVLSGLDKGAFTFLGFIPRKGREREDFMEEIMVRKEASVFFESVHRLEATLTDLAKRIPDRQLAIARELTKKYEEVLTGTVSELLEVTRNRTLKGEFVLVLEGNQEEEEWTEEAIKNLLREKLAAGVKKSKAVKEIAADYDIPRNIIYAYSLELEE